MAKKNEYETKKNARKKAAGGTGSGLWANIHAKRKRIAAGSGEKMRKKGQEGAPTEEAIEESQKA